MDTKDIDSFDFLAAATLCVGLVALVIFLLKIERNSGLAEALSRFNAAKRVYIKRTGIKLSATADCTAILPWLVSEELLDPAHAMELERCSGQLVYAEGRLRTHEEWKADLDAREQRREAKLRYLSSHTSSKVNRIPRPLWMRLVNPIRPRTFSIWVLSSFVSSYVVQRWAHGTVDVAAFSTLGVIHLFYLAITWSCRRLPFWEPESNEEIAPLFDVSAR